MPSKSLEFAKHVHEGLYETLFRLIYINKLSITRVYVAHTIRSTL